MRFIDERSDAFAAAIAMWTDPDAGVDPEERWRIADGGTLADELATYAEIAAHTERVIRAVGSLNEDRALPSVAHRGSDVRAVGVRRGG